MFDFFSSLLIGTPVKDENGKAWIVVWPLHNEFYMVVEPDTETPAQVFVVKAVKDAAARGEK